jgi:HK97 family phage major capsid protein
VQNVQEKIDEIGRLWTEYKQTNDAKIKAIEEKGVSASEQKEKLEKMDKAMDGLEKKIEALNAAIARTGGQGAEMVDADLKEYREFASKHVGRRLTMEEAKDLQERGKHFQEFLREGKHAKHNGELNLKTLSVDSEVGGGFFVIPEVSAEIIKKVNESSPIRQLASVVTISTASYKTNSDVSARAANWQGERSTRSEGTSPTVNQDEIFVHEMDCNPGATSQFLDDAAVNVEAWLADFAAESFALAEATAFVSGHGVGRPRGILSYAEGTVYGKIERIDTDATGSITGDDLIDVQEALKEPYQRNASWLMRREIRGTLRKIKDGTNYLWQPGLQAGAPSTLLEKPVYLAADLNTSLATGTDGLMIYGDFKQGYQVVDRTGIRVLRDPYSSKPKVIFFTTKRVGGGAKNYEALKVLSIL